jgi:hypothetical protein
MYFKAGFEMNSFQSSLSVRIKVGFTHGACIYKKSLTVNEMEFGTLLLLSTFPQSNEARMSMC